MSAFLYLSELSDLFQDLEVGVTVTNAASETAGFPFSNLQTRDIAEIWRSASLTDGSTYIINIDLGASTPWDLVAWINHDFPSDTVMTVKSGTTSSVLDHSDTMTWREFDMYFRATAVRTDRYIRVQFSSPLSSPSVSWQASAGRLIVGRATEGAVPPEYGWTIGLRVKQTNNRSSFNVKHIDTICRYNEFRFSFIKTTAANAATFIAFLDSLLGMQYWFFLIPDSTEYHGYVVRQTSQPQRIRGFHNEVSESEFEEESRGVRISE